MPSPARSRRRPPLRRSQRTALVTGGAGFIGSHLVDLLLERGYRVRVLDDLSTGRLENLREAARDPRFEFEKVDVESARGLERRLGGVSTVFHLAARADIVPSIVEPAEYVRANVAATFRVLEAARRSGAPRFVYAASSSCYGIPDRYPTPETAAIRPQYPYALTKWIGEQAVLHWGQVYRLPVISLRLFNVFGPRSRTSGAYGAVLGVFLAQRLHGKPLTVVGDGSQVRDFVFVRDVVEAFRLAGESGLTGEALNVGAGRPQSIRRLAGLIGGPVTRLPKRPGEPDRTHADISRIRAKLGWAPRVPFEEGVRRTLERREDWRRAPVWTPASIRRATREWFDRLGRPGGGR